jgi:hypothetical protein
MEVVHDPLVASSPEIVDAVSGLGYEASEWKSEFVDTPKTETSETMRTVQMLVQGVCG